MPYLGLIQDDKGFSDKFNQVRIIVRSRIRDSISDNDNTERAVVPAPVAALPAPEPSPAAVQTTPISDNDNVSRNSRIRAPISDNNESDAKVAPAHAEQDQERKVKLSKNRMVGDINLGIKPSNKPLTRTGGQSVYNSSGLINRNT